MEGTVLVPYRKLSTHVLRAVIEDYVTREGTDYGLHEHSLEQKHDAVMRQLEAGDVVILFDADSESVTLLRRDELPGPNRPERTQPD
jgi:uncharacterized protein